VTAEIAARAFEGIVPRHEPALALENLDGIIAALKTQPPDAVVALVGHEPVLSELLARLLTASSGEALAFEKRGLREGSPDQIRRTRSVQR
jgi:phosphohistidine phosphatase SixA